MAVWFMAKNEQVGHLTRFWHAVITSLLWQIKDISVAYFGYVFNKECSLDYMLYNHFHSGYPWVSKR